MNYNNDKWVIINYPPGAGGKLIAACLMLFDNVAHWSGKTTKPAETVNWYINSLPNKEEIWSKKEIDTPWVLPASRLWPRGSDLSDIEFWEKFNLNDNNWFHQCHADNKFIVDFWHKQKKPTWWSHATWINLVVDDIELYKDLLFSKVFNYDKQSKTVTWLDQSPDLGRPTTLLYKSIFQNKWQWTDVESRDQFYSDVILELEGFNWDFSTVDWENYILLSDLFDVDKLEKFLLKFESIFNSKLDKQQFRYLHENWVNTTRQQIIK